MKIYFLGTCAGTEPMPGRKHTSFAIEAEGKVYWFDAGEGCSYTAHLVGLDLLAVKKVVISHTHMDHVGGLGNLMWNISKWCSMRQRGTYFGDVDLYIPNMETWEGVEKILKNTEIGLQGLYQVNANLVQDGVLFDDGVMKVTAYHTHHLKKEEGEPWRAFCYKIECEGKTIVFSGDVGKYEDLDEPIGDGCDAVLVETGHYGGYGIDPMYEYTKGKNIGMVFFIHSGREILNYPEESKAKVKNHFGDKAMICEDGMIYEL